MGTFVLTKKELENTSLRVGNENVWVCFELCSIGFYSRLCPCPESENVGVPNKSDQTRFTASKETCKNALFSSNDPLSSLEVLRAGWWWSCVESARLCGVRSMGHVFDKFIGDFGLRHCQVLSLLLRDLFHIDLGDVPESEPRNPWLSNTSLIERIVCDSQMTRENKAFFETDFMARYLSLFCLCNYDR